MDICHGFNLINAIVCQHVLVIFILYLTSAFICFVQLIAQVESFSFNQNYISWNLLPDLKQVCCKGMSYPLPACKVRLRLDENLHPFR